MTTSLGNVTFFNAGSCRQLAYLAGRTSAQIDQFYAVIVYFEHPTHGACLIDTGYSDAFWDATRTLPERSYRWVTPVSLAQQGDGAGVLRHIGIDPMMINRVFLSHFHADHVGGVKSFPGVEVVCRGAPLQNLLRLSRRQQVHNGFLRGLLPISFQSDIQSIPEEAFVPGRGELIGFSTFDYFGDGSLTMVDLPGHAVGHTGFVIRTPDGPLFYIVDACWDVNVMRSQKQLPRLSRSFQYDYPAYRETQRKLLSLDNKMQLLACHCPATQKRVTQDAS